MSIVEGVDAGVGSHGGHLRELYAAFLDEAATALDEPRLAGAAGQWRSSADRWDDLADAAVPADLEGAAEAVAAAESLHDGVMAGEAGRAAVTSAAATLWAAKGRYAHAFPLAPARIEELFADLGERLSEIHDAEVEALAATADAVGRL